MSYARMILRPGREKSLLRRHPWIYSGAVERVEGNPAPGDPVAVISGKRCIATAAWSPASQLCGRVWSFDGEVAIDENFFRERIQKAAALRRTLNLNDEKGGCRLIYSESDQLPGLIVDRYGKFLCAQFLSAGTEKYRDMIGKLLLEVDGIDGVFDRSDAAIRKKENLPERSEHLCGAVAPDSLIIEEDGLAYSVDMRRGQKTGFYFDLREARRILRRYASGRRVLNLFSYTGAFSCVALASGAKSVLNVDSSLPALKVAEKNLQLNGFESNFENRQGDGFTVLRELEKAGEKFDLVILDPPKLIDSQRSLMRGCRGYQDLARLGFKLLNPGGVMFNFSCSGLMDPDLFQKITAAAALDAGVDAQIVGKFHQATDHPVLLSVPETFYLKGLCSVI